MISKTALCFLMALAGFVIGMGLLWTCAIALRNGTADAVTLFTALVSALMAITAFAVITRIFWYEARIVSTKAEAPKGEQ